MPGQNVCVFCGSAAGAGDGYRAAALELGTAIAEHGWGLVYGGAHVGLMGAVADAALAAGGQVVGVLPRGLEQREVAHTGLTELHIVGTMHERKALMADRSQAFVALPGGMGTLDEFFEVVTWALLDIHRKPCLLVNVDGYYDQLLAFLREAEREGFLGVRSRGRIIVVQHPAGAVAFLKQHFLGEHFLGAEQHDEA